MVESLKKSPKTTVIGVLALVAAGCNVAISLYNGDSPNFEALLAALGGLGFLFTKDSDK